MTKKIPWMVWLASGLVALSALVYYIHFLIFKDAHHIFIYLLGDLGFVFIEVLLVTVIIHRLLHHREKQQLLNKLNMVIGTFFSEVGTELIKILLPFDDKRDAASQKLLITAQWTLKDFIILKKEIKNAPCHINCRKENLIPVRDFLKERRDFLLNLLGNPNLLEHELFTNLLWAVFHLTEELTLRNDITGLSDTDANHLSGDIQRVYKILICQWVDYMQHLKNDYPYLYSLALRTNPFNKDATVEVCS